MRDAQKNRLYTAEQKVRSKSDRKFTSVQDAQAFLDGTVRPKLNDRDRRADQPIVIREQLKGKHSWYRSAPVASPAHIDLRTGWGFTGLVLAHEYAHHLNTTTSSPGHGADFARRFLEVVDTVYQDDTGDKLRKSFDKHHVIWRPDHQVQAARAQVLRLRSDTGNGRHVEPGTEIPFKVLVWATDEDDFDGATYMRRFDVGVPIAGTYGDGLSWEDWMTSEVTTVPWRNLRYVEAKMVRFR